MPGAFAILYVIVAFTVFIPVTVKNEKSYPDELKLDCPNSLEAGLILQFSMNT